jgi:transcriptional regulator GlxA family with amidase domain
MVWRGTRLRLLSVRGRAAPRHVALVAFAGAQCLDVTGPLEVFALAADEQARLNPAQPAPYTREVLAAQAGPVRMSSGLQIIADRAYPTVRRGVDTLIVAGGDVRAAAADANLRRWLQNAAPRVRRLASVCSGAFILAEAGLLDGRRVTTHWSVTGLLARHYPRVTVEPDAIFVRDGNVYTSAGVTAGIDLALALVEEDLGHNVALAVARRLVVFLKRPGGQSQFSTHLAAQTAPSGRLQDLPEWILDHLDADLSVERLAARLAVSPRTFARVFRRETGGTPAKFVERARIDAARRYLEDSSMSLDEVAERCGFGSAEHLRRTFVRHVRVMPHDYRKRFQVRTRREADREAQAAR